VAGDRGSGVRAGDDFGIETLERGVPFSTVAKQYRLWEL
jgi:hypothetical protein